MTWLRGPALERDSQVCENHPSQSRCPELMIARVYPRRGSSTFPAVSSLLAAVILQACGGGGSGDAGAGPTAPASPGVAAQLVVNTAPSVSVPSRAAFPVQPVVQIRDAAGRAVLQAGAVITVSISAGGGTLGGTTIASTTTSGAATFTDLSISGTVGARTLTFAATGLASATAAVTLTPGSAATISVNTGNNLTAPSGAAVLTPPSVKVTDADANAVSGVAVIFSLGSGGGSITGGTATTSNDGIATIGSWTMGPTAGTNALSATSAGLAGSPITFTATAVEGAFSVKTLSSGYFHTCALAVAGTLYCWGMNDYGQLGDGTTTTRLTPVAVSGGPPFESSAAKISSCALTAVGAAYCWGRNDNGQLGDGSTTQRLNPVLVSGGLTFQTLSAGTGFACGLTPAGAAYCWGRNVDGTLGDGTTIERHTPTPVGGSLTFKTLSSGSQHSCALTNDGFAYCWGSNIGNLGDGTGGNIRPAPVRVLGGLTFQSLSAGTIHTCGVTTGGAAYCWGENNRGQLGDGTTTQRLSPTTVSGGLRFQSLAAGGSFTCALTIGGSSYCWGGNSSGQLGNATNTGPDLCDGGTASCSKSPILVSGGLNFQKLSAGGGHTCGLTTGGVVYCWGDNTVGQLGIGTRTGPELCIDSFQINLRVYCSKVPVALRSP